MGDLERKFSRRAVLRAGASATAGAALVPLLAACGDDDDEPAPSGQSGDKPGGTITFSSWGGDYSAAWKDSVVAPFTAATGVKVVFDDAPGEHLAKLRAQERAGQVSWDLIEATFVDYFPLVEQGLLQPLPKALVDKLKPVSLDAAVAEFGVAAGVGANGVVVTGPGLRPAPMSPAEYWDVERFPGARGMWKDGALDNVVSALLADGVPIDELTPLDYDRAFAKLDEIRSHVEVFWTAGDQLEQIVRDGEIDTTLGWDGRAWNLRNGGTDVEIGYDGALIEGNFLVVPKDAPNPDAAFAFIEYYGTHPEAQAGWVESNLYMTSHAKVAEHVPPKVAKTLWPMHDDNVVLLNPDDFDVDVTELQDRWYEWLEG